jgi:hypothetical protein
MNFQEIFGSVFYVSPRGEDISKTGSIDKPYKSISYALNKVVAKDTIILDKGIFIENKPIFIDKSISIIGKGMNQTIIKSNYYHQIHDWNILQEKFLIQINGISDCNFQGFTLDGDKRQTHGGMFILNTRNVHMKSLRFKDFNFCGLLINKSNQFELSDFEVINSAWPNVNSCSGAIMIGNLSGSSIHDGYVAENKGYGIKTCVYDWGKSPKDKALLEKFDLYNVRFKVQPYGAWANGMSSNFCLEYWNAELRNCRIFNCYFNVTISLPGTPKVDNGRSIEIFNNQFIMEYKAGVPSYAMEMGCNSMYIHHNHFKGGYYPLASFGPVIEDNCIDHNVFENVWGIGIFGQTGMKNTRITNNTFYVKNDLPLLSISGNILQNIEIRENLFYCYEYYNHHPFIQIKDKLSDSCIIDNNWFYNWNPAGTRTRTGNPELNLTGDYPYFFTPKIGGALDSCGYKIGAL